MNNDQAKFMLRGYRPNGADAGDPQMAEALEQARIDPELGTWFAGQRGFDSTVAAKLRTVAPPAGLREAILTGGRVSRTAAPRGRRTWPRWLAAAAAVAVLCGVGAAYWLRGVAGEDPMLTAMTHLALTEPESAHTGPHADRLGSFGAWLQNPANRVSQDAALDFAQLEAEGCRAVTIGGRKVFEICFNRNGGWYHLYFTKRRAGESLAGLSFREQNGRATAGWADRECLYVLMAGGGLDTVRRIL
jgi:hypothetical protein